MLCALFVNGAALADDPSQPATAVWDQIKRSLFGERPVSDGARGVVELIAPDRAEDAAVVPIAIRTQPASQPERRIRRIYLIVDNNPSPVGATFEFAPGSRADIETRIRIEQYTYVRAVAELTNGELFADTRFVKAAGGCSAPANNAATMSAPRLGRMRLAVGGEVRYDAPVPAELMISHPNHSGLVMDQVTRLYTPAYFVRTVRVTYAGRPVLTAAVDFSISENPNFRFYFVPTGAGELKAEAVDTKDLRFETALAIKPSP